MSELVAIIIIGLPLISGSAILLVPRLRRGAKLWLITASILFIILAVSTMAFCSGLIFKYSFVWQPEAGEINLVFDRSSLLLISLVGISLWLLLIYIRHLPEDIPPVQYSLLLFSFSSAAIALSVDHFLLRFAALEFTGLWVIFALAFKVQKNTTGWDKVNKTFLNLKLGDLILLTAILLMRSKSGTFQISESLDLAQNFIVQLQWFIVIGLMIAVWIKLTLWPLGWWAESSAQLPTPIHIWYSDLLLPMLGAYLLYRISPLLPTITHLRHFFTIMAVLGGLIGFFLAAIKANTGSRYRFLQVFPSICLLILATSGKQLIVWAYLIYWLVVRIAYSINIVRHEHSPPYFYPHFPIDQNAFPLFPLAFSFLALSQISSLNLTHPLTNISLWIIWWLLMIQNHAGFFSKGQTQSFKNPFERWGKTLQRISASWGLTILGTILFNEISYWLTHIIKGEGVWLLYEHQNYQNTLLFLAYGSIPAILIFFYVLPKLDRITALIERPIHSIQAYKRPIPKANSSQKYDPLDQSALITRLFMSAAHSLYAAIEQNSINRIWIIMRRFSSFLFNKIEKAASADFWKNMLNAVLISSRGLQRWNPGLLRLNLFWFLLFIIILILILTRQNPGLVLPIT